MIEMPFWGLILIAALVFLAGNIFGEWRISQIYENDDELPD